MSKTDTKLIEFLFTFRKQWQAVNTPAAQKKVLASDIVAYVEGIPLADEAAVVAAIESNPLYQQLYTRLLLRRQFDCSKQLAAASTANLVKCRQAQRWKVERIEDSEAGQVYLALTVDHPQAKHFEQGCNILIELGSSHFRLCFPPLVDHVSQVVLAGDDQRLLALFDAEAVVTLV